jgi:hypothetical protein
MQNKSEEELLDDLEEENENDSGQHTSHSPVQTPPSLKSDESGGEDGDEVSNNIIEEGQEIEMDSSSTQQALVERR